MRRNNVILQPNAIPSTIPQQEFDPTNYAQIFANLDAKNQQANALNAQLEQRQREERTPLDDWRDKRIAEIQAQKANPIYQKEQEKKDLIANLQAVGKAMNATKQVSSMKYNGYDVVENNGQFLYTDGKNTLPVEDPSKIQKTYNFDPQQAMVDQSAQGNLFAGTQLASMLAPKSNTRTPEQADAAALAKEERVNAEWDRRNGLKEDDTKANQVSKLLEDLGVKNYSPADQAVISGAFHTAKGDKKATDKLTKSLLAHTSSDWIPFRNKRWLWQDNFAKDAQ